MWGIREGVIATDQHGTVQVVNARGPPPARPSERHHGAPRLPSPPPAAWDELFSGDVAARTSSFVSGERVLLVNRRPVRRDGRDRGPVVTLRDRTELEALARELDSVRGLTDAMRAQSHEFANRLYTLSGLLQLEHYDQALDFIHEITAQSTWRSVCRIHTRRRRRARGRAPDREVGVAVRRGVDLKISTARRARGKAGRTRWPSITVLGNLIDNALDAVRDGTTRTSPGSKSVSPRTPTARS